MADFNIAFKRTIGAEGGYVNDPDDRGGETYMGISRKAHPTSVIWKYVDNVDKRGKTNKQITDALKRNRWLTYEVKEIYRKLYWDKFQLDYCNSQRMANEIFDDAVNRGVAAAAYLTAVSLGIPAKRKITLELLKAIKDYV